MKKFFVLIIIFTIHLHAVTTGIYKIEQTLDYDLLKELFPVLDTSDEYTKKSYEPNYENMIDKDLNANWAVATREDGSSVVKVILLNTKDIKNHNVSYNDNVKRKYISLSFTVYDTKNTNKQCWSPFGLSDGFFDYSYNLKKFAPDEYIYRQEDDKNYEIIYDRDNFYVSENLFILKSYKVKSFMLSSEWEKAKNPLFGSRLKEATYKTIQQAGIFNLQTPRNYTDILYIPKTVSFHQDTKEHILSGGDFLAITSNDDEWYYGDLVGYDGTYISGKVYIDDLLDGEVQIQYTKNHKFKIFHSQHDEYMPHGATSSIHSIGVYDKNDSKIQTIRDAGYLTNEDYTMNMIDANFDGYDDLIIYSHDGGAGPNEGYNFYIYNPENGKFEFHEILSELTQTRIDKETKTIHSAWRSGAASHGSEEYKWIDGILTMTKQTTMNYTHDGYMLEEEYTLDKNGNFVMTKQTKEIYDED